MIIRSLAFAALLFAGPASAQEYVELTGGFGPESHNVTVYAGGGIDASTIANGCVGMVGESDSVTLSFTAYGGPLVISAYSEADTSLVVNGPDGRWYCNDDTEGLNPRVNWNSAQSGVYNIRVGAVSSSAQDVPVVVAIME
jgi:hypothetical protein